MNLSVIKTITGRFILVDLDDSRVEMVSLSNSRPYVYGYEYSTNLEVNGYLWSSDLFNKSSNLVK